MYKIKNTGKGFTLLELLIVVLIIGILAAIALPQYQKIVNKTKFAKLQSTAISLRDAYNEYVLLHGESTKNFSDLSITLPDEFQLTLDHYNTTCMTNSDMSCCLQKYYYGSSSNYKEGYIVCYNKEMDYGYYESLFSREGEPINGKYCIAKVDDTKAGDFCAILGTYNKFSSLFANTNSATVYLFYKM